ncbi:MAG: hypothetical protein U5Q03_08750 [Bacteroidota bacterium]|nr:hypothetical protein [Bacteroidota bacterium]
MKKSCQFIISSILLLAFFVSCNPDKRNEENSGENFEEQMEGFSESMEEIDQTMALVDFLNKKLKQIEDKVLRGELTRRKATG